MIHRRLHPLMIMLLAGCAVGPDYQPPAPAPCAARAPPARAPLPPSMGAQAAGTAGGCAILTRFSGWTGCLDGSDRIRHLVRLIKASGRTG